VGAVHARAAVVVATPWVEVDPVGGEGVEAVCGNDGACAA